MGDRTHIQWTDATWNPVTGCTKISDGCRHCYIDRCVPFRMQGRRFTSPDGDSTAIGATTGTVLHPDRIDQPIRWMKPRRVFVCSLADLFHADVPDAHIADVFAVMLVANQHTFQVLTKRPARMRAMLTSSVFHGEVLARATARSADACLTWPLPNVWVGVTAETQEWADIRIPTLLETPAAVRFLSCEPLLGPIDLSGLMQCFHCKTTHKFGVCDGAAVPYGALSKRRIDWVIVGGESGPGARPMHPDWARSLRDQCTSAAVAFHFKQWGEWAPSGEDTTAPPWTGLPQWHPDFDTRVIQPDSRNERELWLPTTSPSHPRMTHVIMRRIGKRAAGRELDGRTWDEYPTAIRAGGSL